MVPHEVTAHDAPWILGGHMEQGERREARPHVHERGQIFGIARGVMALRTQAAQWLIGPGQLLWLPPSLTHEARSHGAVMGWSLYVHPERCQALPAYPFLSRGSDLLNAQAVRLARQARNPLWTPVVARLAESFWDEFLSLPQDTGALPFPQDARLRRVAQALTDNPSDRRSQPEWARLANMSQRSFVRHFAGDTGLSFSAWRQRLRIAHAYEKLAQGESVASAAMSAGYESFAAFSKAFIRLTGVLPSGVRGEAPPRGPR
ncbi:AraC family transcriptional regulator [Asaia bogorensis]|uniref:AraC family transcriptional regulator n=1 Tax=Asaia bogorensis NBRC 16594 TaxID=1231624 RepID=A0AAN4U393_9PROT|nr:helix-turn-helix transcriptional regulator [Asaia bogorensis]GBQ73883.1 AraC family transcriptional regulator [Asaia bogorensis NBRC 16594]GEL53260.1 AraC family transcriptional regulator [Asaia bogorensis NBRC 16594]